MRRTERAVSSDKTLCIPAVTALSAASSARLNKNYTQHGTVTAPRSSCPRVVAFGHSSGTRRLKQSRQRRSIRRSCRSIPRYGVGSRTPGVELRESRAVRGWLEERRLVSVRRSGSQSETRGHCHQVRKRVGLHLAHDLASVRLNGDLTDAEFAADLFVQQPRNDQCHDLAFT